MLQKFLPSSIINKDSSVASVVIVFSLCILLLVLGNLISPGFSSVNQLVNLLTVAAFLGIVSMGQTIVVISGKSGIDLSVGNLVTFGAILGGSVLMEQDSQLFLALFSVIIFSFVIGVLSGICISIFQIPALIMTIGMGIVVAAINQFLTGGVSVGGTSPLLKKIVLGKLLFLPNILFIWIFLALIIVGALRNTLYGKNLFAIGNNERAAKLVGIQTNVIRIIAYGLSSLFAGITGFLYLGYLGSVYNITLGDKYTLPSIVAVVIGGTKLTGGQGGYLGVLAGAILLQILDSVLITIHIEQYGRNIIFGIVLLVLMFIYGREKEI